MLTSALMSGKKKLLIGLAILFGLAIWPLSLGVLIAWLIYKKIGNKKIRYGLVVAVLLPAFLINSVWTKALFSSDSYKNSPKTQSTQNSTPSSSPLGEVSGIQTSQGPIATLTATSSISPTPTPTSTPNPTSMSAPKGMQEVKVDFVVDGDTIKVLINGNVETIRLIGIDTPETVDPRKPVQCFGREASNKAKEILNNQIVYLESDPTQGERDKYQRLLRYVWLGDNTNFNKLMILEGYAHEYTYAVPYKYQTEFKQAEKEAEESSRGLWSPNTCSGNTTQAVYQQTVTQSAPANVSNTSGSYSCDCSKTCEQISSCAEAQYQLNTCSCKQRDADHDGIACDRTPLNCQSD